MKLYLAGPMTGFDEFNYPAFNAAAARLREAGHDVINPAENDGGEYGKEWSYYMRLDMHHVLNVEGVAVLPGWEASRGARLEVIVAVSLGLPIFDARTLVEINPEISVQVNRVRV